MPPTALESAAHLIQLALTPVFLLSGVGSLLIVFSNRFARIADQVDSARSELASADGEQRARLKAKLGVLSRRIAALVAAVISAAAAGVMTLTTALTLFLGVTRDVRVNALLFVTFGAALLLTGAALSFFLAEMLMAGRYLRVEARRVRDL